MIFTKELKRIFSPVLVLIIILLSVIFYFVSEDYFIKFRDSNGFGASYVTALELHEKLGDEIDASEFEGVMAYRQSYVDKLNKKVEESLSEYGVKDIFEYHDISCGEKKAPKGLSADLINELEMELIFCRDYFIIQQIDGDLEMMDTNKVREAIANGEKDWFFSKFNDRQMARLNEIMDSQPPYFLVNDTIIDNFYEMYNSWTVLILIACCILILPYLVKNRISNVTTLHYSTRRGKSLLRHQLAATLAAGAITFAVLVGVFYMFFSRLGVLPLINCRIFNTGSGSYWFDFTFLGYMITSWLRTLALVIAICIAMFWISNFSKNYIVAIVGAIPVILPVCFLLRYIAILEYVDNSSFKGMLELICAAIVIVMLIVSTVIYKKYRKRDFLAG